MEIDMIDKDARILLTSMAIPKTENPSLSQDSGLTSHRLRHQRKSSLTILQEYQDRMLGLRPSPNKGLLKKCRKNTTQFLKPMQPKAGSDSDIQPEVIDVEMTSMKCNRSTAGDTSI